MAFQINFDYQSIKEYTARFLNYGEQGQLILYHYLNNLAHVCDAYFSFSTITTWTIIFVLIWSAVYIAYSKIIVVIFKRMLLPPLHRSRLIESLWNSGFSISCVCLCVMKLVMHENLSVPAFNIIVNSYNYFTAEEVIPAHMLCTCLVVFTFFIHGVILTSIQKGLETEFFNKGLFVTFLYAAYCLRYIWLGLNIVILTSICTLCLELIKVFYSLNRGKSAKSGCLRSFVCLIFAFHCILWGGIFLYVLPKYYLLPAISIKVTDEKVRLLILLAASLWGYFWLEVCYSPAIKLIWYYLWPDYSYGRRDWLDYVLFPPRNDVIEHLKRIRSKARLEQANSFQYDNYIRERSHESDVMRSRNSAALFQTVKCVMAMKKRIRRRREAKALEASQATVSAGDENTANGFVSQDFSGNEHKDNTADGSAGSHFTNSNSHEENKENTSSSTSGR